MSFPRYPQYKDSGVDWLGQVPAHWEVTRTKNLFQLMSREPQDGDEIVTAFRDGEVTLRSNRRIDGFTNAIHEHGYQRILKGDLVIHAMDAFAGAIGVSDSDGKSTPVYSVCTPKSADVDAHYYGRLMRYMAISGYISSLSKGIRERSTEFRWNEAANVLLAVPPVAEQRQIAAFLDRETGKIDALVAEQERLLELLKEKRQAVISHAVTRGLNPNAPLKPSGLAWLGNVPAHWEVVRLKNLASERLAYGANESAEDDNPENPRFIRITDIADDGSLKADTFKSLPPEIAEPYLLQDGDLLLARSGATVGKSTVYRPEWGRCCYAGYLIRMRCDLRHTTPAWINLFTQSAPYWAQIGEGTIQATIQNFSGEKYGDMKVPLPPLSEQRAIVAHLDAATAQFDALTAEVERALALLQERRTALISAAVTGQIDVRRELAT